MLILNRERTEFSKHSCWLPCCTCPCFWDDLHSPIEVVMELFGCHWERRVLGTFSPLGDANVWGLRNDLHIYFWPVLLSFKPFDVQTSAWVCGMHTNEGEVCIHTHTNTHTHQQPTHTWDKLTYGPLFWAVWAEHQSSTDHRENDTGWLLACFTEGLWFCDSLLN